MKKVKKIAGIVFAAFTMLVLFFGATRSQDIRDWMVLRDYRPSQQIEKLAVSTSMTELGQKLFYVHDPQIESKAEFNVNCTMTEHTLVLGCYNGVNIYIYDVTDQRLKGVHEVTAAHEMLHVAYERLSDDERKRVDYLTSKQLQELTNERIQKVVSAYRSRDASVVPNELHSIFGTEVRSLDPELEAYYSQYFIDRSVIVAFSEQYEQVFTSIQAQVALYDNDLQLLKGQIDEQEADLRRRAGELSSQRVELERLAANNQINEYNELVPRYNNGVEQYNRDVALYKTLISDYNQTVQVRNDLTLEQNELVNSLNSRAIEL